MGNIPVINQTPQTQESPRVRVQPFATPESFGAYGARQVGMAGEGLAQAGTQIAAVFEKLQADKDEAEVRESIAAFRTETRELFYGPNGYLTRQGKDANGVTEEAQKTLDKLRTDHGKRFNRTRSRTAWDKWSNIEVVESLDSIARHEAIQIRQWEDEADEAQIESARQQGIDNRDNPQTIAKKEKEIQATAARRYGRYGEGVVKLNADKIISAMHADIIDEYLKAGERTYAYKHFQEHKDALLPEYRMAKEELLKRGARKDEILADAYRISSLPFTEQLKYIQENYKDVDEHDDILSRIEHFQRLKQATDRQAIKAKANEAWNEARAQATAGNFMWEPPEDIGYEGARIKSYLQRRFYYQQKGMADIPDDDGLRLELEAQAKDDPVGFVGRDLDEVRPRLSGKTWDFFKRKQLDIGTKPESATDWRGDLNSMMEEALAKVGYGAEHLKSASSAKKKKEIDGARARFKTMLDAYTNTLKVGDRAAARKWIDDEIQMYVQDRLFLWGDVTKPRFMWTEEQIQHGDVTPVGGQGTEVIQPQASVPPLAPREGPPRPRGVPNWPWNEQYKGWVREVNGRVVRWYDEMGAAHSP